MTKCYDVACRRDATQVLIQNGEELGRFCDEHAEGMREFWRSLHPERHYDLMSLDDPDYILECQMDAISY